MFHEINMSITINLYYTGTNGDAQKFVSEMESSGIADKIRNEEANLRYEYFIPVNDKETVLLIDSWENQQALDVHHASPMMNEIAKLRDKYDLSMKAERYISEEFSDHDNSFLKK